MTPGEPLATAEFELTPEEWAGAAAAYLWDTDLHHDQRKSQQRAVGWIAGTFVVSFLAAWTFAAAVAIALAGGLWAVMVPRMYRRLLRRSMNKAARSGAVNGLFGPHRLEVRTEGLRDVTPEYETLWRWSAIEGVEEVAGTFVIRTGPPELLPLPSSAFRDGDALRRFGEQFYAQVARARPAVEGGG